MGKAMAMSEQQSEVLDGLWRQVDELNRSRPDVDDSDERWRAWFEAHIAVREELLTAGVSEVRRVPAQIAYFRVKVAEVAAGDWLASRMGYWNQ